MKNYSWTQAVIYIICFFICVDLSAQCNDLTLTLTPTNSTCLANGTIKVAVSGPDAANIRQSDMQFQVSGTLNISWANYSDNTISSLPAGTYTISLRAFCYMQNDWIVTNTTATATLTSSYIEMNVVAGVSRRTLSCKPTGMIPLTIMNNTGSAPFTITMTSYPVSYTGTKTFVTSTKGTPYQITDLPAGNYTFSVSDDCSYTKTIQTTVETRPVDVDARMIFGYLSAPPVAMPYNCDIVSFLKTLYSDYTEEELHYYFNNPRDYFEIAFLVNNTGTLVWLDTLPNSNMGQMINYRLPAPYTIKTLRDNAYTITPYIKIKGTSCITQLPAVRISVPDNYLYFSDVGCTDLTVRHEPSSSAGGNLICYPYQWRIVKNDNTVFLDWQGPVMNYAAQTASNVPFGSRIEYVDNEGYTWVMNLPYTAPAVYGNSAMMPLQTNGITNNVYHSYIFLYISGADGMPAGTRIKFLSGPTTPVNTDFTLAEKLNTIHPFSANYKQHEYSYIAAGIYQFEVTFPGCSPTITTVYHYNYKIIKPFSYTTEETCGGLRVFPSGQLGIVSYAGMTSEISTYFQIFEVIPFTIPADRRPVSEGDTLLLPASGEYHLGMTYSNMIPTPSWVDTIHYTQIPFTLNPEKTSAYLCNNENIGYIHVAGMGGSGNYLYELYDEGVFIDSNTAGIFHYGTAGNYYTIRLIDTDPNCFASYDQQVNMIDLGIAQIAYTNSAMNRFCLSDSIYLKCITLGETMYEWSGPGITNTNKNLQNPAIAAATIGVGTHTFTIKVTPTGCGQEMQQILTVTVEDCSGARDDYLTMFMNTTASVDVLANDAFPLSCAGSVVPVVTVNPTQGSFILVNKQVIYTPNMDFTGRDSLTYSTSCSGAVTSAKVYIVVLKYPDNITKANCFGTSEEFEWAIRQSFVSTEANIHTACVPFVGDIDGDGIPEIIVARKASSGSDWDIDGFYVYKGTDRSMRFIATQRGHTMGFSGYAIARIKIGLDTIPVLVMASVIDSKLYAYNLLTGAQVWVSNTQVLNPADYYNGASYAYNTHLNPAFADFNNDGIPEIFVANRIFDATNGNLLVEGPSTGNKGFAVALDGINRSNRYFTVAADVNGDGRLELLAGTEVYQVNINSRTNISQNSMTLLASIPNVDMGGGFTLRDGITIAADINRDGRMDVIVCRVHAPGEIFGIVAWDVKTQTVIAKTTFQGLGNRQVCSVPFVGNIDDDPDPEIVVKTHNRINGLKLDAANAAFTRHYEMPVNDAFGSTGITLFDFNQDGTGELVYRDETRLRVLRANRLTGDFTDLMPDLGMVGSVALHEYPVVADVDGDGAAEIVTVGGAASGALTGTLRIYRSGNRYSWSPTRKVWNQYAYNAVNVNEDLTIPQYQTSPAAFFPNGGQPFNSFLQQQTLLNVAGGLLRTLPDVYTNQSLISSNVVGDSVSITIGIVNQGDAAIGSPVYVSLYKETSPQTFASVNRIAVDSAETVIMPGEMKYVTVRIADITPWTSTANIVIRLNDDGTNFTRQAECDSLNNVVTIVNPALHRMMKKNATLMLLPTPVQHNGFYSNPVSVLFNEEVEYKISAFNANLTTQTVTVRDTMPVWLKYVAGSADPSIAEPPPTTAGTPSRSILEWSFNVGSMQTATVSFRATPQSGVNASQPLFINRAWVTVNGVTVPTNYTYHQGAGVSIMTFSAGFGGHIYNATEQALDYRTSPRSGIVVAPDEGYRFAGWRHADYLSLRGETIRAQSGVMHYDTLTVYGNVALYADFEPESYTIEYHLHGGSNGVNNPSTYTIESTTIALDAPEKADDVFIGWTGSNGNEPQPAVIIPRGSTGERTYYANYLYSGRHNNDLQPETQEANKIWAVENMLYVKTSLPGSILRIYSMDGVLQKIQTILQPGETTIQLLRGLYVVTLNNGAGQTVRIE